MNDVLELLRTRRTVHVYRPDPLPDGTLDRAFEAATAAPNHRLTEPWRFRRTGPETRARLLEIYLDIKSGGDDLSEDRRRRLRARFLDPAELIVVSRIRDDDHVIAREDYAAVACAVQNLMLALHAEGVGSKWTTGAVTRDPRTYDATDIDFDHERIEGFVWAGIATPGTKPARCRSANDIITDLP